MPQPFFVGDLQCHIISDGIHYMDGGGFFGLVPRVLWQRVIRPNEVNQIPVETRSLLVESDAGLILVDTGIGDKLSRSQRKILGIKDEVDRLISELSEIGCAPEDIDIVVLTHLHSDHAGGATRWLQGEEGDPVLPSFPNARYIVQRKELLAATNTNERTAGTYFSHNWQPLVEQGLLDVIDGPLKLGSALSLEVATGHTEAIQIVKIVRGEERLYYLGDACSWAVHLERLAWVPSFDILPMTSIETKRRLRREALKDDALLLFQHDAQVALGRLEPDERGVHVVPVLTDRARPEESQP